MILSLFAITVSLILYTRTRLHPFSWVLPWVLPAALISWACLNFAWWEKINKEDLYRLRPHNKTGLYELAVNDPDPWVRSTLAMYYFMRDTMGGKTVFTYSSSDVFISQYLHSIAGIKGIFFKPYNYLLAANEVEYLLALPHAKHGHFDGKTFFFCFDGNIASKNEAFYMMSDGKDIFVVSGETFIRMRGQA